MTELEHELVKPTGNLPFWLTTFPLQEGETPSEIPPHWHQGIELSYTLSGAIDHFQIDSKSYQTKPGQIILVNSQSVHSIQTSSPGQALSMIFPYPLVSSLFPKISELEIAINDPSLFSPEQQDQYQRLQAKLTQIYNCWSGPANDLRQIKVNAWAFAVLAILLEHFTVPRKIALEHKLYITQRMQSILDFIYGHYHEPIGLTEIATDAHISKEYLARFFKKNMGMTVAAYLRRLRASAAKKQLMAEPASLDRVAESCGFSGLRSMNRALIENYGQSASELRQKKHE